MLRISIALSLSLALLAACGSKPSDEPAEPAAARPEALAQAKPSEPPATPAPAEAPPAEAPPAEAPAAPPPRPKLPLPGYSVVSIHDKVPFCVFASEADRNLAPISITQAKKQTLRADKSITFGAYPPWCVHESCDQRPSLQCWADVTGNTIVLNTRYFGDHKDGSTCTKDCRPINAGCDTAPLPAGKYTIKQGEQTWNLRIPSVLAKPCFVPKD